MMGGGGADRGTPGSWGSSSGVPGASAKVTSDSALLRQPMGMAAGHRLGGGGGGGDGTTVE